MKTARTIIFVSDGTAITAETLAKGLLSQFEGIAFHYVRFPFTDSLKKADDCLKKIAEIAQEDGVRPVLIMTMMDEKIAQLFRKSNVLLLDLFDVFIAPLELELGQPSTHSVGRTHGQENREYSKRIAAMNFALAHDDGVSDTDLENADIILVGVSRSGKTPTSLYLSLQFSLKAANYPLIPEDFERDALPSKLQPFRDKLYGLTISPEQLHRIRDERRANSVYASLENCRYEVAAAERMMRSNGIKWFDTTQRSIEELAVQLIQALNRNQ